jgi:ribonucleotide reductase alpha subunit
MRRLLLAFFEGQQVPAFDYSIIRPKGSILKGFGGVASGPDPLIKMHLSLHELLLKRVGNQITSVDIVDLMNFIGKCVVSGNIRRSAQIALGLPTDDEYVTMKDPDLHGNELMDRRWASNNSIIVDPDEGFDYKEVAKSIAKNGEPGIIWLENARRYSRMDGNIDWKDKNVNGVNPCFSGDTLIAVADGRGAVSIRELAIDGMDVPVYSLNGDGIVEIKMGRHPRVTGHDKELLKITFDDGTSMKVIPDHGMILLNGTRVEARDLRAGDSLPRFSREIAKLGNKKYLRIFKNTVDRNKDKIYEHRMIGKFFNETRWNELYQEGVKNGYAKTGGIVVHHRDGNTFNNRPGNLEIKPFTEHYEDHGFFDVEGEKNPMHGKVHSEETKALIGERTRERCQDDGYKEKLATAIKAGMENDDVRKKISDSRHHVNVEYYKEFEKITDLETVWIDDHLFVKKHCEACGTEMILAVRERERCYCSLSCGNKKESSIQNRAEGQHRYFEEKQRDILHAQIIAYKDMQSRDGRNPMKSEWESECKARGVPSRLNKKSGNPNVLKSYADLKERAASYNHRVASLEPVKTREDVYNITVDDDHTVGVILFHDPVTFVSNGVFTPQCGEQSLESWEMCNLVETFPSKHDSYEEFKETLKLAYLYAKSVTLMRTHWKETNAVMLKNRRIGTSVSGIVDAFAKHGRRKFLKWLQDGYAYLKQVDEEYSNWLCVPKSVKISTIKPSGTTSLLAGVSPGIHYPHSKYYIRRIRVANDSDLLPALRGAGYPVEPDAYDKTTMVVEFPMETKDYSMGKNEASMEMQIMNAVDIQRYWSDNQVSITVTFTREEAKRLAGVLEFCEDKLKGVSFLPLSEHGYVQAPYEEITREKFEQMVATIKPIDSWTARVAGSGVTGCDGDRCTI